VLDKSEDWTAMFKCKGEGTSADYTKPDTLSDYFSYREYDYKIKDDAEYMHYAYQLGRLFLVERNYFKVLKVHAVPEVRTIIA